MTTQTTNQRTETISRISALMEKRNEIIKALSVSPSLDCLTADKANAVYELCDTLAQIAVYKTLSRLSDSPKDLTTNGAEMCAKLYRSFSQDMAIYRHKDTTQNYSDAFDLYNIAYMTAWQYLDSNAPLTLDDTVLTVVKKNGNEKNYTLFQVACKDIREYIHSWSKSDQYKKLHYVIGIADNGKQVTTSKRPADKLTDITAEQKTAFFTAHGLTAREQEVMSLYIKGEKAETIATLLALNVRMVQRDIKSAKAKFPTANAYAELKTAQNAEKLAKAKAEKNPTDSTYERIYHQAQERTAKAYTAWKNEFKKGNR